MSSTSSAGSGALSNSQTRRRAVNNNNNAQPQQQPPQQQPQQPRQNGKSLGEWVYNLWIVKYIDNLLQKPLALKLIAYFILTWYCSVFATAVTFFLPIKMQLFPFVMVATFYFLRYNWQPGQQEALAQYAIYHPATSIIVFVVSIFLIGLSWKGTGILPSGLEALIDVQDDIVKQIAFYGVLLLGLVSSLKIIQDIFTGKGIPMPGRFKILLPIAYFLVATKLIYEREYVCNLVIGREYPDYIPVMPGTPDNYRSAVIDVTNDQSYNGAAPAWRVQHGKAHGCVKAEFVIDDRISPYLRYGLFTNERSRYSAYVRFSNSNDPLTADSVAQVRGMAVKLLGVTGPKMMNNTEYPEKDTHDFLFVSSDVFFSEHPNQIPDLTRALPKGAVAIAEVLFGTLNPSKWGFNTLLVANKMAQDGLKVYNPLSSRYWSSTPYRLGPESQAVKYSVRPCFTHVNETRNAEDQLAAEEGRTDYLREAMRRQLKETDACFDFLVQMQVDACKQPIEDPTVSWGEGPWVRVAQIHIPKQEFLYESQNTFCENLAFNPWNSLPEHRPLGNINKMRLPTYSTGANYRRKLNNVKAFNVTGDEAFAGPVTYNPNLGTNRTLDFRYTTYGVPYQNLSKHAIGSPDGQSFPSLKVIKMALETFKMKSDTGKGKKLKPFSEYETPYDFRYLIAGFANGTVPPIVDHWTEDWAFAAQWMYGINPMVISTVKAKPIPKALNLTAANVKFLNEKVLGGKTTIDKLKAEEKLFVADYEVLDNVSMKSDRVVYAPIILFYLNESNVLLPLVIQLTRFPTGNEIYTNQDPFWTWIFARMHAMSADAVVHEMVYHLQFTHLAMEPIVMAFYRQLPADHPIFQLMKMHFYNTIAINDLGRKTLLRPTNSVFDMIFSTGINGSLSVMQAEWSKWNIMDRAFPNEMKRRGFYEVKKGDKDNLPGFYYRDDGFLIWHAIRNYINSVVLRPDVYGVVNPESYTKEQLDKVVSENMLKDERLQALRRELVDPNMADIKGTPEFNSLDNLVDFLSTVLFTASAQHSAVNFGQFDYYSFIPNRPVTLHLPMPAKDQVTTKYIMEALPKEGMATTIVQLAFFLSLPLDFQLDPTDTTAVGYTLYDLKDEIHFRHEWKQFIHQLKSIDTVIETRNAEKGVFYPYLIPNRIAASIAI